MKTEIERIADQLERMYAGQYWPGGNISTVLKGIDESTALRRVPGIRQNIHEIVRHIIATDHVVCERLEGRNYVLTPEEDWPHMEKGSLPAWKESVEELYEGKEKLLRLISRLDDNMLDQPILPGYSSIYVTLHGMIQHTSWHFGQINLMKSIFSRP